MNVQPTAEIIQTKAVAFEKAADLSAFSGKLLELIGDAQFVLIGEASHGTHEFYECRAAVTKLLIEKKMFAAVAVEADFPDAYRINRFVRGIGNDRSAEDALGDFQKFPLWMWRNTEVLSFVEWLKSYNDGKDHARQTGFYGIDLYSLHASMEAVLNYLNEIDPEAAQRARSRYSCFDHHGEDASSYGYAASYDLSQSCEDEAVNQLLELRKRAAEYANRDGFIARDEFFFAEQNARLVKNAEEYYREMFRGRVSSWNLRDRHMSETLDALSAHLENQGLSNKIVVWAHNSHLGDASATDMIRRGEWNVGQLTREKHGREKVRIIGFSTYTGAVTAATDWDDPPQVKKVRPALKNSVENLFHETGITNFFLNLRDEKLRDTLNEPLLERAIGVIYRPETERVSHYFEAYPAEQFDAIIHFDQTRALEPLDRIPGWSPDDAPDTYPSGI